jgi:hypothetical protein
LERLWCRGFVGPRLGGNPKDSGLGATLCVPSLKGKPSNPVICLLVLPPSTLAFDMIE